MAKDMLVVRKFFLFVVLSLFHVSFLSSQSFAELGLSGSKVCFFVYQNKDKLEAYTKDFTSIQKKLLRYHLLPTLGPRVVAKGVKDGEVDFRSCRAGSSCLTFEFSEQEYGDNNDKSAPEIKIEWTADVEAPTAEALPDTYNIKLPQNFDADANPIEFQSFLRRSLIGHPLHPYILSSGAQRQRVELGEPDLYLKQAQVDAVKVAEEAIQVGEKKL